MRTLKRSECSILPLVLKGEWYDMIASGVKREEYREATPYWRTRFRNWTRRAYSKCHELEKTCVVEFRLGYAHDAKRMAFAAKRDIFGHWLFLHSDDTVDHPEWGEKAVPRYIIALGERVELEGGAE